MGLDKCRIVCYTVKAIRPVGQAAKTPPSQGGNMGSIPVRVTKNRSDTPVLSIFCGRCVCFDLFRLSELSGYRHPFRMTVFALLSFKNGFFRFSAPFFPKTDSGCFFPLFRISFGTAFSLKIEKLRKSP